MIMYIKDKKMYVLIIINKIKNITINESTNIEGNQTI